MCLCLNASMIEGQGKLSATVSQMMDNTTGNVLAGADNTLQDFLHEIEVRVTNHGAQGAHP